MNLLSPDEIQKSRVYFTEFDRVTYSQVAWSAEDVEGIKLSLERKLKLLALVKGHVVIKGLVTPASLRDAFAARLLSRGVPVAVVTELLGDQDTTVTRKRYGAYIKGGVEWVARVIEEAEDEGAGAPRVNPGDRS